MNVATRPPLTWVVGAGGLLGQHVAASLRDQGRLWPGAMVPWATPRADGVLRAAAAQFVAASGDDPWQVVWAAGAGVTSAGADVLAAELSSLEVVLDGLAAAALTKRDPGRGAVFFASSAGALYAGSPDPPFDELSPVRPLAPYGEAKLRAERFLATWSANTGIPVLAGRIANLYGPGQNMAKAQGLISQLCWHDLVARPLTIYVPLDTIRDYVYAPDCALLVLDSLAALRDEVAGSPQSTGLFRVRNLASGRAVTIANLVGTLRPVLRHKPLVIFATRPATAYQALNLALRSRVYRHLDDRQLTPLPVGIAATRADLALRFGRSGLQH